MAERVEIHTRVQTMTPAEVAKRLGLSTSTVSRPIKAGEIRTLKVFLDANILAKPLTRTLLIVGGSRMPRRPVSRSSSARTSTKQT